MQARFVFVLKVAVLAALVLLRQRDIRFSDYPGEQRLQNAALYFIAAQVVIDIVRFSVVYIFYRRMPWRQRVRQNLVVGVRQLSNVLVAFVFVLAVLYALNIEIVRAFTSLSIVAAALAIVGKDYVANVINGFIVIFGNQLAINDYVRIGAVQGKIQDITLSHIHILTDYSELVYYPNGTVLAEPILNYTKRVEREAYLEFEIPLIELKRLDALSPLLQGVLQPFEKEWLFEPELEIESLYHSYAVLRYYFSFQSSDRPRELKLRAEINKTIANWLAGSEQLAAGGSVS